MADIGALRTRQQIPNAKLPSGEPGSRSTVFLRATPAVFGVVVAGSSNQDFVVHAAQVAERPSRQLGVRLFVGFGDQAPPPDTRPAGLASEEAFGDPHVRLLRFELTAEGIASLEAVGSLLIGGILPPPSAAGEPGNVELRDDELTTCWAGDERDVYVAHLSSAEEPVYGVTVSTS